MPLPNYPLRGIFGGTFDPIHMGHLLTVDALNDELEFSAIHLLPNATPPHRSAARSDFGHRLKMVELAIQSFDKLLADPRENQRSGPSYTIDTLKSFRADYPKAALTLIVGMDSYLDMPNWYQWQYLLDYAHIIVLGRPGYRCDTCWGEQYIIASPADLSNHLKGKIYFAQTKQIDLSATQIRAKIEAGEPINDDLPVDVMQYIVDNKLYV